MQHHKQRQTNQRLREERLRRHWSQQELADQLGTTVTSIKRWERKATTPSAYFRLKLTALFNKSAQELGLYEEESSAQQAQALFSNTTRELSEDDIPIDDSLCLPDNVAKFPVSAPSSSREQSQMRMIEVCSTIWIDGMLKPSLRGAILAPELYQQPELVANPWRLVLQELELPARALPSGTTVSEVYDANNGHLLILGEPGVGKTTLLLELARTLLDRARQDPAHPIPVVFNLSSWPAKKQPLEIWLLEEMQEKYQVPCVLGRHWLATDAIIPLLDGLDEVAPSQRMACVETINHYRYQHGLSPIVICSRYAEYTTLARYIILRSAIIIQPLTAQQIQSYLASLGEQVEGLRSALCKDTELQELATTPLMLQILISTYHGVSRDDVHTTGTQENRRRQIFGHYVENMFRRRSILRHSTPQQMILWLSEVAKQLLIHQETELRIEHLQFSWLSNRWTRRLLPGVCAGCIQGLLIGLLSAIFIIGLFSNIRSALIIGGFIGMWNAGLCSALNGVFGWFNVSDPQAEQMHEKWPNLCMLVSILSNRGMYGFLMAIFNSLFIGLLFGLLRAPNLLEALRHGAFYGLLIGCAFVILGKVPQVIHSTEIVYWSWQSMRHNMGKYLAFGVVIGLAAGIVYPLVVKEALVILTGLGSLLIAGVSNKALGSHQRLRPNQGIRRSARSALQSGARGGLFAWLILSICLGHFYGLFAGIISGLLAGLSLGICFAMQMGGTACLLHIILRWLLWQEGKLPLNVPRFLDEATDLIFLRKIGGGYLFLHRFLLEYFATVEVERESNTQYPRIAQRT